MEKDIELNKTAEILHKHWAKWVIETFPGFQDVSKESFDENFSHQFVIDAMEEYWNAQQHSISDEEIEKLAEKEYYIGDEYFCEKGVDYGRYKFQQLICRKAFIKGYKANTLHGNSGEKCYTEEDIKKAWKGAAMMEDKLIEELKSLKK